MNQRAEILADLVAHLRSSVGASVALHVLDQQEDCLTVQVGGGEEAVVGVQICDPEKPSFTISYPELKVARNGRRHTTVTSFEGALRQGVEWVVRQVAEHGAVRPEFLD